LSFPETLRPLERFHDKGSLAEAPVFVEADPRELAKRNVEIPLEELTSP
jgi:hypothetical protein